MHLIMESMPSNFNDMKELIMERERIIGLEI
jgi:hypothetical protein